AVMRLLSLGGLLVAVSLGLAAGQEPRQEAQPAAPPHKGLAVHEWGVFRVNNDVDLANADMRAIWDGLPPFVYGQLVGRELPKHWRNVEIRDRPVIFFHAAEPVDVALSVEFPGGMAGVWWPGTQSPAIRDGVVVGG